MFIYVASDNLMWLLGLTDAIGGAAITDATVTSTIYAADQTTEVATVLLNYVAGSQTICGATYADGNYRGQLPASTPLAEGANYWLQIIASYGGNTLTKMVLCQATYDGDQVPS